jgi:hypothetical protein
MVHPSWNCLAGRSALPLDPGDGGHRGMLQAPRGKRWSQRSRPCDQARRPVAGSGAELVGRCACGWGSGMPSTVRPDPSTPTAVGERGSHHKDCSQSGSGCLSRARGLPPRRGPGRRRWRRRCAWSWAIVGLWGRPLRRRGPGGAAPRGRPRPAARAAPPRWQARTVNQPAGTVTQQHGPMEVPGREGAGDGLAGGLGSAAATQ